MNPWRNECELFLEDLNPTFTSRTGVTNAIALVKLEELLKISPEGKLADMAGYFKDAIGSLVENDEVDVARKLSKLYKCFSKDL